MYRAIAVRHPALAGLVPHRGRERAGGSAEEVLYGALNNLAHPGNTHLLEEHLETIKLQSDSNVGLSPIPIFNSETAKGMCELHVHLCFQMIREFLIMLARVHGTSDSGLDELVNELNGLRLQIAESLPHSVEPASKPL
jgi:hypothetical protein